MQRSTVQTSVAGDKGADRARSTKEPAGMETLLVTVQEFGATVQERAVLLIAPGVPRRRVTVTESAWAA